MCHIYLSLAPVAVFFSPSAQFVFVSFVLAASWLVVPLEIQPNAALIWTRCRLIKRAAIRCVLTGKMRQTKDEFHAGSIFESQVGQCFDALKQYWEKKHFLERVNVVFGRSSAQLMCSTVVDCGECGGEVLLEGLAPGRPRLQRRSSLLLRQKTKDPIYWSHPPVKRPNYDAITRPPPPICSASF